MGEICKSEPDNYRPEKQSHKLNASLGPTGFITFRITFRVFVSGKAETGRPKIGYDFVQCVSW